MAVVRSSEFRSAAAGPKLAGGVARIRRFGAAHPIFSGGLFAVLLAALLYLRRPAEFMHPYVWDEDGTRNLRQYLDHGAAFLMDPVSGYLILVPKLIALIALKLSFSFYPLIANVISTAFEVAALMAVWKSPTILRAKPLCALAIVLIPTDPEVFVLPLYTFWLAGVLILLALLWRSDAVNIPERLARYTFITLGGLSSPLIIPLAPFFIARAAVQGRREAPPAAVATAIAAIQLWVLHSTGTMGNTTHVAQLLDPKEIGATISKYFGFAFGLPVSEVAGLAAVFLAGLAVVLWQNRNRLDPIIGVLGLLYATAILLSLLRVPASAVHPYLAGPRYFFYPFVLLYWFILNLACGAQGGHRAFLATLVVLGLGSSALKYQRDSDGMNWTKHVAACLSAPGPDYAMPIQFDGHAAQAWVMSIKPQECRRLRKRGRGSTYRV